MAVSALNCKSLQTLVWRPLGSLATISWPRVSNLATSLAVPWPVTSGSTRLIVLRGAFDGPPRRGLPSGSRGVLCGCRAALLFLLANCHSLEAVVIFFLSFGFGFWSSLLSFAILRNGLEVIVISRLRSLGRRLGASRPAPSVVVLFICGATWSYRRLAAPRRGLLDLLFTATTRWGRCRRLTPTVILVGPRGRRWSPPRARTGAVAITVVAAIIAAGSLAVAPRVSACLGPIVITAGARAPSASFAASVAITGATIVTTPRVAIITATVVAATIVAGLVVFLLAASGDPLFDL